MTITTPVYEIVPECGPWTGEQMFNVYEWSKGARSLVHASYVEEDARRWAAREESKSRHPAYMGAR